jgi:hypothetical protein
MMKRIERGISGALAAALFLVTGITGCSTARAPGVEATSGSPAKTILMSGSFLEIDYVRGNNTHRFIATMTADSVHAECYRDRQLVRARNMDPAKYLALVREASDLVKAIQAEGPPKGIGPCRTPFTLKLKSQDLLTTMDGCRSTQQGVALGKLIKDAEFSVLSENDSPR